MLSLFGVTRCCVFYENTQWFPQLLLYIDGLHLTSWRPCWRYNTKEYVINSIVGSSRRGWLTLSAISQEIDCKPRILRINDPQKHKVLYTWELYDVIVNFQYVQDLAFFADH